MTAIDLVLAGIVMEISRGRPSSPNACSIHAVAASVA